MMYPTLVHDYLSYSAQNYPEKVALIDDEKRLSYKKLNYFKPYRLARFLHGLQKRLYTLLS